MMGKTVAKYVILAVTVLVAVVLLASAWGGLVNPEVTAVTAMLNLAFPLVVPVALVWTVVVALMRLWRDVIVMAVALVVTIPVLKVVSPLHLPSEPAGSSDQITIMSWNVMGFDDVTDSGEPNATMRYILDVDPDVVVMQETQLGPMEYLDMPGVVEMRDEVVKRYPYHTVGYHDIAIMSKYPYRVFEDSTMVQGFGALDNGYTEYHFYAKAFDLDLPDGQQLRLLGVHMQSIGLSPNEKDLYVELTEGTSVNRNSLSRARRSLYAKLAAAWRRRAEQARMLRSIIDGCEANLVVCGDFNDAPTSYSYRTVLGDDLHDAYAECALGPTFTFNQHRFYFKIDHFMYRGNLRAVAASCPHVGMSDHYPQVVTLEWQHDTGQ